MICSDEKFLYIATDRRKKLYLEVTQNSKIELASYNLNTRKWLRVSGSVTVDYSKEIQEKMILLYPMISQEFIKEDEINLVILKMDIQTIVIK